MNELLHFGVISCVVVPMAPFTTQPIISNVTPISPTEPRKNKKRYTTPFVKTSRANRLKMF